MTARGRLIGKRILLVEDQKEVREATGMLLRMDEHAITEAGDGEEAAELFTTDRFDLVITDCVMPRMSGDKLAVFIKHKRPSQPILMITGSAEIGGTARENIDALLYKPFSLEELRQTISTLLSAA